MSPKLAGAFIVALLFVTAGFPRLGLVRGDSVASIVNRSFYFTSTTLPDSTFAMGSSRPPAGTPMSANSSELPLEFEYPPFLQLPTVTIYDPLKLSLWLNTDKATNVSVTGILREKPLNGNPVLVTNGTSPRQLIPGIKPYNLTLLVQTQPLVLYSKISLSISFTVSPAANVTVLWGSQSAASLVVLRLSGFDSLSSNGPLDITDRNRNPATSFDLNSTIPNNVVIFQANVVSAFGFEDISRVNMTIFDQGGKPVKERTNIEMLALYACPPPPSQPCPFTASWIYPSNATEGTYRVDVTIIDIQNSTVLSFRGAATFGLTRTSILVNYLPYFGAAGAALVGGAVYYRRRKTKKSYLAPFDYFNALTGGELEGGTVVLVEGNTGSGKTLLSEELMFEDLRKGKSCVFVATGDFPSNIRSNMRTMGLDATGYEQNGLLSFVDGYSSEAGQESREKFSIPSLGDLTTMGVKISSSIPKDSFKDGSLYFDSLTPLASRTKSESIVSFVQSLGARVRGMGGKAFFTVGPSLEGNVQRRLEEMADCVVQMEAFEEGGVRKSRMKITKLRARRHQQGWVIYTIQEGKGIIFYSKKPRTKT